MISLTLWLIVKYYLISYLPIQIFEYLPIDYEFSHVRAKEDVEYADAAAYGTKKGLKIDGC